MRNGSKSEESRWAALVQHHHSLVDRKYTTGLTAAEIQELDEINDQLDQLDGSLYQPIVDRARGKIARRVALRGLRRRYQSIVDRARGMIGQREGVR